MAKIEMIDPDKPIDFVGHKTIISDEPKLVDLAKRLKNNRLLLIATPVTETVTLDAQESKAIIELISSSSSRNLFDENLQGMANTAEGEPLLTGWMSLIEFNNFMSKVATSPVAKKLITAISQWDDLGVEDVYFDGYERTYGRKHRNSVLHEYGSGIGVKEKQFMLWPSVGVKVPAERYMAAVKFLEDASDIFFDGELIIIPEVDGNLIDHISTEFEATEIVLKSNDDEYANGFGDEFATKAIEAGVNPELIILGNSLRSSRDNADAMVSEAISAPAECLLRWQNKYRSAMSKQ